MNVGIEHDVDYSLHLGSADLCSRGSDAKARSEHRTKSTFSADTEVAAAAFDRTACCPM